MRTFLHGDISKGSMSKREKQYPVYGEREKENTVILKTVRLCV
jgi:hypothetical protein